MMQLVAQYGLQVLAFAQPTRDVDDLGTLQVEPANMKAVHRPGAKALDTGQHAKTGRADARHGFDAIDGLARATKKRSANAAPPCSKYQRVISTRST